jgi:Fic family protein
MVTVPGSYKRSLEGYDTFVPRPLPPELLLPPSVYRQVEDTAHLLGQVERSRTLLPNADLLVYTSLQREALASSTIEGTIATADELVLFQASRFSEREAVREVANYRYALEWGVQEMRERPLATGLILGLHERLMAGVRGSHSAGRFKEHQNHIGRGASRDIEDAIFIPSAPPDVPNLIYDLERYIHSENREPKLVQCALVHYQFETIHPFADGNGRVGRLLIILQMIELGLLSAPLIYPSVYFERTRDEYYQRLQDVRELGAWNEWIEYFVLGIKEQCEETISFTQAILDLRKQLHREIPNVRRRASMVAVLEAFFEHPVLTPKQISDEAKMSLGTVRTALAALEHLEIAREITGRRKGRVYACEPLLDAIFER